VLYGVCKTRAGAEGSGVLEVLWQLRSGKLGLLSNLICLGMGGMIGRGRAIFSVGSACVMEESRGNVASLL